MGDPRWQADFSKWPLVVLGLDHPGDAPPVLGSFVSAGEEILARAEPCVVIVDLTGSRADAPRRKVTADWLTSEQERIQRYVRAAAVVAPVALHRGALAALQWVTERSIGIEWEPFPSRESAMRWIAERQALLER